MSRGGLSIVAVMIAVVVPSMVGCGSEGDSTALTKAQFVKQGNAICGKWQQERAKVIETFNSQFSGKKVSRADKEKGILQLLEPYEEATSELSRLSPPEGDEKKIEAILDAMDEGSEEIRARPLIALTSNDAFEEANELTASYGLKECAF